MVVRSHFISETITTPRVRPLNGRRFFRRRRISSLRMRKRPSPWSTQSNTYTNCSRNATTNASDWRSSTCLGSSITSEMRSRFSKTSSSERVTRWARKTWVCSEKAAIASSTRSIREQICPIKLVPITVKLSAINHSEKLAHLISVSDGLIKFYLPRGCRNLSSLWRTKEDTESGIEAECRSVGGWCD